MKIIAIDTIGTIDEDLGLKYTIDLIDCFTRYEELFPKYDFSAIVAANALSHN